MSDIKCIDRIKNEPLKIKLMKQEELQTAVEESLLPALGIVKVVSNYQVDASSPDKIQTLGYDENFQLVLLEYRIGKFGKIINKGVLFLDYIHDHKSQFKLLLKDHVEEEVFQQILFVPRLIIIGDDFNKFDEYAVRQLPYSIDLIKVQQQGTILILEKNYQSKRIDHAAFHHAFNQAEEEKIYKSLSEYILSLGDEVAEMGVGSYLVYRKMRTFAYVIFEDGMMLHLKDKKGWKSYPVTSLKDVEQLKEKIEKAYDEN